MWKARICFIEDNLDKFDFEKALVLSMLWANVYFLGCRYPSEAEGLISDYVLPEDHSMHSPKGDVYYIEVKEIHTVTNGAKEEDDVIESESDSSVEDFKEEIPDPEEEMSGLEKFIEETRQKTLDLHAKTEHELEGIEGFAVLLEGHWVKQYLTNHACAHPVSLLHGICAKHGLSVDFPIKSVLSFSRAPTHQATILVDSKEVCAGTCQSTKKEAKKSVAEQVVNRLKEMANASQIATKVKVETVQKQDLHQTPDPVNADYGKGSELLKKMGWRKNESLGKDPMAQSHMVSVVPRSSKATEGLGFQSDKVKVDSRAIRNKLLQFKNSDQDIIEFPVSLTSEERKMVHEEAHYFGLVHKSFGAEPNKYIVVRKKEGGNKPSVNEKLHSASKSPRGYAHERTRDFNYGHSRVSIHENTRDSTNRQTRDSTHECSLDSATKVKVETVQKQDLHQTPDPVNADYGKGSELLKKMGWRKNESLGKNPMANASQIATKVKVETVQKQDLHQTPDPVNADYGKGSELLKKMGWRKNESLGKDPMAQSHMVSVVPQSPKATEGLGFQSDKVKVDSRAIRNKLLQFKNSDQDIIEFPVSLTSEERKMVHEEAHYFGLVHKSFGVEPNKYIVRKKEGGNKPSVNEELHSASKSPRGYAHERTRDFNYGHSQVSTHENTRDYTNSQTRDSTHECSLDSAGRRIHNSYRREDDSSHRRDKGYAHSSFFRTASLSSDRSERRGSTRYNPYRRL